jgi:ABC-type sugar transport system permease subunit
MTETRPGPSLPGPSRPLGGPSVQKHKYRKALTPYILVAPAVAIVVAVLIYPMYNVVWTSLWEWDFRRPEERKFVGLANYADVLLRDRSFRESIRFTVIFTVVSATIEIGLAIATAMAIHRTKRWAGIIATVIIMPFMLASLATGFMWRLLFNLESGLVNWSLGLFGVEPISWLTGPISAPVAVIIAEVWQFMPFVMLIVLAGLKTVPTDLEEAARNSGATEWQVFRNVVLPLVTPALTVALIFQAIFKLRAFDIVVALTEGGPGGQTTPIGLLVGRTFTRYFEVGYASAMSVIMLLVGIVIAYIYIRFVYRELEY